MKYFLEAIKNYAVFQGRSSRIEFWMFALFGLLIIPVALSLIGEFFFYIYSLFILIPTLAIMTRRVHDTGKQGALVFLALIPFIGFIIVLILCLQEGNAGPNMYGPGSGDIRGIEPNQPENQSSYPKTAVSDQTSRTEQQNTNPQELGRNKGYGCAFASGGLLLGGLAGGIIGFSIGLSQGYTGGESIGAILFGIIGIPIGAIAGMALGAVFGSKKRR